MNRARLVIYAMGVATLSVALYVIGFAGLAICAPHPLPGDELWTWRNRIFEAWSVVLGGEVKNCAMTAVSSHTGAVITMMIMLAVTWETLGPVLRRVLFRSRGGHAILFGSLDDLRGMISAERKRGSICIIAPGRDEARKLTRVHPFADISVMDRAKDGASPNLQRLGAEKARFIAAVSRNDLDNIALMETALAFLKLSASRLMLRIEAPEIRALLAYNLRQAAHAKRLDLTVVSLIRMHIRDGIAAASPGRYIIEGGRAQRFVLIGSGELMQGLAIYICRQGYGLEIAVPELTILQLGTDDFTPGATDRLLAAGAAVAVKPMRVDGANAAALDRAIAAASIAGPPLTAVHCTAALPGAALALALRFERVLIRLGCPVPPIVAYCAGPERSGETQMIRCVAAPKLTNALEATSLQDRRAVALHDVYQANQKSVRGPLYGEAPGERPWAELSEQFQVDNRAVADHIDYKLARIGHVVEPGTAGGDSLSHDEIETLAAIEHARWVAAKAMEGWRHGVARDEVNLAHPSMLPYHALDDNERRKDRDVVTMLPAQLGAAGLHSRRSLRAAIVLSDTGQWDSTSLDAVLIRIAERPLTAVIRPHTALSNYLQRRGHHVEVVLAGPVIGLCADRVRVIEKIDEDWVPRNVQFIVSCDSQGKAHATPQS